MTQFLVTGCLGFIGSNLAEELLRLGHRVVGLDNESHGSRINVQHFESHPNFKLVIGDIRDLDTCLGASQGIDYVLHQAALGSVPRSIENPSRYHDVNVSGTLNLLEAARHAGVKRIVYASSSSVYGDTPTLPKIETMSPNPKSPYAATKLTTEIYASVYYQCFGLETIGLRYFNVFGPRQNPDSQYAAVIPRFITAWLKNESPIIFGDGEQTRDFTFIENVVNANIMACTATDVALGQAINVGCGTRVSLNALATLIQAEIGSTAPIQYAPARAGDVKDSLADVSRLTTWLGLTNPVDLAAGLRTTIDWYRS